METNTTHYSDTHNAANNSQNYHHKRSTLPTYSTENSHSTQTLTNLSPRSIHKVITKLPNNKAPGPDKISTTEQLKNLPKKIIAQIYYIFKACILLSYFPAPWKTAKIHPIPKPEKPTNNTHRPVSLLNTLSEVLEKIIHLRLLIHLNSNQIIKNSASVKNTPVSTSFKESLIRHHGN